MSVIIDESVKAAKSRALLRDRPTVTLDQILTQQVGASYGGGRVSPRSITSGTFKGEQRIGDELVKIDSANGRIIINDGENDRVLIGKDEGGF